MTNRLELNWKLDGFVDEQRYYCSETPIDPANLSAPKAILAGDARTYIDSDSIVDVTYYIRVSSVRNGVEKLSEELTVTVSSVKNILIVSASATTTDVVSLKTVLESLGHTVAIKSGSNVVDADLIDIDLLIGASTSTASTLPAGVAMINAARSRGIPIICSRTNGLSNNALAWSNYIGLTGSILTSSSTTKQIRTAVSDSFDILLKSNMQLDQIFDVYTAPSYIARTPISGLPSDINVLAVSAVSAQISDATVVLADSEVLNLNGIAFGVRVAFIGFVTPETSFGKDLWNNIISWACS